MLIQCYTFLPVLHGSKKHLYNGILVDDLSKGNLLNPFGVQRAPSEPVSVYSVVKNPASKSHFIKNPKTPALATTSPIMR